MEVFGGFKNTHVRNADTARLSAAQMRYQDTVKIHERTVQERMEQLRVGREEPRDTEENS